MDPVHGEISRAMRNRGVEIFLLPETLGAGEGFPEDKLALLSDGGLEHVSALRVLEECRSMCCHGNPCIYRYHVVAWQLLPLLFN